MDIQKLRFFISVSKNLSLTEAAAELGVTQSAVSQQLTELERQIGAQLFIRNKRPFQLTWVGKMLLEEAYTLVAVFNQAFERIQLASLGKEGHLTIGFLGGMENNILPQALKEFHKNHPHIVTNLQQYHWTEINDALSTGKIDIGFTLAHRLEDYPDLVGINISSSGLWVAVHHSHPRSLEKMITLTDLIDEPFVMFDEEADPLLNEITIKSCAEHGFLPNVVNRSRDLSALLVMVATGMGIMLVPGFVCSNDKPDLRFIELGYPKVCLDIMVARNCKNHNPSVPIFIEQFSIYNKVSHLRNRSSEKMGLNNLSAHKPKQTIQGWK